MGSILRFVVNNADVVGAALAWVAGQVAVAITNDPKKRRAVTRAGRLAQDALTLVGRTGVVKHANTAGSSLKLPLTDAGTGRLTSTIAPLE